MEKELRKGAGARALARRRRLQHLLEQPPRLCCQRCVLYPQEALGLNWRTAKEAAVRRQTRPAGQAEEGAP